MITITFAGRLSREIFADAFNSMISVVSAKKEAVADVVFLSLTDCTTSRNGFSSVLTVEDMIEMDDLLVEVPLFLSNFSFEPVGIVTCPE